MDDMLVLFFFNVIITAVIVIAVGIVTASHVSDRLDFIEGRISIINGNVTEVRHDLLQIFDDIDVIKADQLKTEQKLDEIATLLGKAESSR